MKNQLPYISIVGIKSQEEINKIVELYNSFDKNPKRILSLGFTLSDSHIKLGIKMILSKKAKSYQYHFEYLKSNFPTVFPVLHFHTKEIKQGFKKLRKYIESCNAMKEIGIQFNLDKPVNILNFENLKRFFPRCKLILQFNQSYFHLNNCVCQIFASQYENIIDYSLLDCSRGKGKPIDIGQAVRLFTRKRKAY